MNPERSAQLAGAKLRGLLREHLGAEAALPDPDAFGSGSAVVAHNEAWVYVPEAPAGTMGAAVSWALARRADGCNLLLDGDAGSEAFAATGFGSPRPVVWTIDDRSISLATPVDPIVERPPACPEYTAILHEAGLEVVADHGVWIGEINGLELARIGMRNEECAIDIGVGAYDQFASSALAGDRPPAEALADVVSMVRPHRIAGAAPHPMGRLVRSRWLRAQIVRQPALVGLAALDPIPMLQPRPGLMELQRAAGLGHAEGGAADDRVLVVCSVGLDLGVAETAAGLAALHRPDRIVIAMPQRDHHPRILDAAERLVAPTSVVAVEGEWTD